MRKAVLLLLIQSFCAFGFAQNMPPLGYGTHFQCANADVRWKVAKKDWPKKLWVYRTAPTVFSPAVISNLTVIGLFTEKERKDYGSNGMLFSSADGCRNLRISFPEGTIQYWSNHSYGPTNLAKDVPKTNQLFQLTTNILPQLGIRLSEIATLDNSTEPKFSFDFREPGALYFVNDTIITNIESRGAYFRRAVDGREIHGEGGKCELDFGERGQITRIWMSWRKLERDKLFPTPAPKTIIGWLREGRAAYWPRLENGSPIPMDWSAIKCLTVKKAKVYYWGSNSSRVFPYLVLWTTVDASKRSMDLEIVCPIIDEPKPERDN